MSAVGDLLGELRRLNVTIWHDGDRIRYRAPSGALTPELLARLREHRDELTSFLAAATAATVKGRQAVQPIRRAARGPVPLSFAQERLWFLHQLEGPNGGLGATYNVPAALRLQGPLDPGALQRAVESVVDRHAILRTRFAASDEGAVQIVESTAAPVARIDLSAVPEHGREEALRAHIQAEAAYVFALDAAPPTRFSLIRLGDADHVLCCVLHHLVTDGWSMGVFFRELVTLYDAFASDRPSPLAELAIQYADYAVHERASVAHDTLTADLDYWRAQLAGAPATIELPLDRARRVQQSYRGGLVRFELDRAVTAALKGLAQECNASLFMVLLAAYAVLLSKYAGQEEIVIGSPVANRDRPDVESLVGPFSNYIPLRVDLRGDPSVRALIARVRSMTLDAYAHQHVPFEKLVDAAQAPRRLDVAPLFQVALVLQNLPAAPLALSGVAVRQLDIDRATAKLDVSVLLEENDGCIRGEFEYCADLFEPAAASRMARQFGRVAGILARQADRAVSELSLLSPGEQAEILDRWSGAAALRHEPGLVHQRFRDQAARTPEATAVVAGDEHLTYAELALRAARLARYLVSFGLSVDSRVAVCLPRSTDIIVTLLAVLEAGGAYVPLDGAHPPERLAAIVTDSGAELLVTTSQFSARVPGPHRTVLLDRDAAAIERCEPPTRASPHGPLPARSQSPEQLAYVIYTSGSTGRPKGVMVEHRAVCSLVRALADAVYARHRGPINVALVASVAFDASVQQIFGSLLLGHALHVVDDDSRHSGEQLLEFFARYDIALTDVTPSLMGLLLDAGLGTRAGLRLEHLLVGGEALAARLVERLHAQDVESRIVVTNLYGPTECGVDDTFRTVHPGEQIRRVFVPIGRALSNARVYVLDGAGNCAAVGVPGDIWIGGACLARGYLGQSGLTARAYRPDPALAGERLYSSGDRGRWTDDGELEFLGRIDDQVKLRGYRVELAEIEAALLRHGAIKDAVAVVHRAEQEHARLVAYVVPRGAAPSVSELHDHLATTLPAYMVPSAFMVLERLPINASGKVDRARMPALGDARELVQGVAYIAPRDAREQALADAWAAVLGRQRIGADDRFFALGGDSIKALQVVSKLRQCGLRLELRDLFVHQTLSALAPFVTPLATQVVEREADSADVPLGPVQAAFLYDHPGPRAHFHQALLVDAGEVVNLEALNRAIAVLYAQHGALRARFRQQRKCWIQTLTAAEHPPVTEVVDLRGDASPGDTLRVHAAARMAATDLANGPLFAVVLYRLPDGERVLLAAHHLVVDGVSWRILVEDLESAYRQVLAGRPPILAPPTDSYARWASAMRTLAEGLSADEQGYWEGIEQAVCAPLPVAAPGAAACQRDRDECRFVLSQDHTQRLLSPAHDAYGTRMDDLLLVALGRALSAWAGSGRWRVLLESHGREPLWDDVDVSRTVGWFTARYPVLLDIEAAAADVGRQIKLVKEMLRRVPHGGGAYEAVRYLTEPPLRRSESPAIAFNYLGQLGRDLRAGSWRWVDEETGSVIAPDAPLVHDLELIGFVMDDCLHVAIGYGRTRFEEATIATLAAALERELIEVVEHTTAQQDRRLTPSDIDYDGFGIEALDTFLATLEGGNHGNT